MSVDTLRSIPHQCPAETDLIERYTEGHDSGQLDGASIEQDLKILSLKQTELRLRAIGCQGVNADGTCPVRQKMDADPVRRAAVSTGRTLLGLLRR